MSASSEYTSGSNCDHRRCGGGAVGGITWRSRCRRPGDATALGEADRMDADVGAARDARYIAAFEPEIQDLNGGTRGSMEVASLMHQLEELDQAAQRSVAAEVESELESRLADAAC